MRYLALLSLSVSLFAKTSFISPLEYASQLYKNPRGIGCHHCHGDNGEGKLIAKYSHKNIKKEFAAPAINTMDFKDFYNSLKTRKLGMPQYYLTKKEVEALFLYLNQER